MLLQGIKFNKKFFDQLIDENLNIVRCKEFHDHHQYSIDDLYQLLDEANKNDAFLITTEKIILEFQMNLKARLVLLKEKLNQISN